MFMRAYEHMLNPIKSHKEWPLANLNPIVPWCNIDKKPGRPSKHARRKEKDELKEKKYGVNRHGMKYACSNCGMRGHTKKSCIEAPNSQDATTSTRSKQPVRKKS
ncbi:hypothetical protein KSP39_PZI005199 [Platanthera zijinensis]|uniref:CCHC-type domain-containing protein n=1 Tax=Platanthera zijinensis TaxID=2320716 RepID=A0AAP0BSN7_9ASPA